MQPLYLVLAISVVVVLAMLGLMRQLKAERNSTLELRATVGRAEGQLDEKEREIDRGEARISELEEELAQAESQVSQLGRDCTEARTNLQNRAQRCGELEQQTKEQTAEIQRLGSVLLEASNKGARLEADVAGAKQTRENIAEFLTTAHTRLSDTVGKLAGDALIAKSRELQTSLQQSQQQSRTDLEGVLRPFGDRVAEFRQRVEQLYGDEANQRSELKGSIGQLTSLNQSMADAANGLTRALTGNPKTRGSWGELVLETVLQSSGLKEDIHYVCQASTTDESGARLTPDVVVNLPDNRQVVVDSKLNLVAWHEAMNCNTDEEREVALRNHASALRLHVKQLSDKNYPKAIGSSALEVTIAFIAIEGALSGALSADMTLQTYAFERGVVFASPNTLMAVLIVVERLWTRDKITRMARDIGEMGGKVLDAAVKFMGEFDEVEQRLSKVNEAFNVAKYSLQESQQGLVSRAKKLVELGARGKRALPEQLQLDETGEVAQLAQELAKLSNDDESIGERPDAERV